MLKQLYFNVVWYLEISTELIITLDVLKKTFKKFKNSVKFKNDDKYIISVIGLKRTGFYSLSNIYLITMNDLSKFEAELDFIYLKICEKYSGDDTFINIGIKYAKVGSGYKKEFKSYYDNLYNNTTDFNINNVVDLNTNFSLKKWSFINNFNKFEEYLMYLDSLKNEMKEVIHTS